MSKHVLRPILSGGLRLSQEALIHGRAGVSGLVSSGKPRVVFLPSKGREGSALLRQWAIAPALGAFGWSAFVMPPRLGLAQRHRLLSAIAPDVVVMQGSRHPLNDPSLYPGRTILYDMDDADFRIPHLAQKVQAAMSGIEGVIAGSRHVARWCLAHGAPSAEVVWTGTPVSRGSRPPQAGRGPIMAWAQTRPDTYIRERAMVLRLVEVLAPRHPDLRLRLYDRRSWQDDSLLAPFRAAGISVEWTKKARYSDYIKSFDDVVLGLSPIATETPFSRGKSFGKVLAYLDRKVPVIASDAADHALFFTPDTGVITNDPALWVSEADRLLRDHSARQAMVDAAHVAFRARLSIEAAAGQLSVCLDAARAGAPGRLRPKRVDRGMAVYRSA